MEGSYDPRLVALSMVVAVIASFVALDLAGRVGDETKDQAPLSFRADWGDA